MQTFQYINLIRVCCLVLSGMMLFSRFVFQATGHVWMRSFLDAWKHSLTHRIWGWIAFVIGLALLAIMPSHWNGMNWIDRLLSILLVVILSADGLLNLFPSWFGHFKEKMQDAWVKKNQSPQKAGDKQLFGTVNFFLGLASLAFAIFVYSYRPLELYWVGLSTIIAIVLMTSLIVACKSENAKAVNQST